MDWAVCHHFSVEELRNPQLIRFKQLNLREFKEMIDISLYFPYIIPMSVLSEGLEIVQKAEKSVAELAQKALEQCDYATAASLMSLAGELRDIATELNPVSHEVAECSSSESSSAATAGTLHTAHNSQRARAMRRSPRRGEFPKFLRDEEILYKLGWSKAEKSVYEHKAPKSVLLALVNKLKVVGANRRRFAMDNVLPLTTPTEGTELPTYQVYICLAWLRMTNILVQHGRQGYSISHPARFESDVEKCWQKIPLIQDSRP